jgi:hypothetical protein
MRPIHFTLISASVLVAASSAYPQVLGHRPATDIELKAAYCLEALKLFLPQERRMLPPKEVIDDLPNMPANDASANLAKALLNGDRLIQGNLSRLQRFITLRLYEGVDPVGLLVAGNQADEDDRVLSDALKAANCPSLAADPNMTCSARVDEQPAIKEIEGHSKICGNLSWLPF